MTQELGLLVDSLEMSSNGPKVDGSSETRYVRQENVRRPARTQCNVWLCLLIQDWFVSLFSLSMRVGYLSLYSSCTPYPLRISS
jgi:hypothetical protein